MKTLRKIGIILMSVFMVVGIAACSDDDDKGNTGGKSGNGVLKVGGRTYQLNYCYIYDSDDGELLFGDFDMLSGKVPTKYQQFSIAFERDINTINQVSLSPDEYEIEFNQDGDLETCRFACDYDWVNTPAFLNVKHPGNLTITRNGNNITVKIDNLWVYGGEGYYGGGDYLSEGFEWQNGSFQYSGPMIDVSAYIGD